MCKHFGATKVEIVALLRNRRGQGISSMLGPFPFGLFAGCLGIIVGAYDIFVFFKCHRPLLVELFFEMTRLFLV